MNEGNVRCPKVGDAVEVVTETRQVCDGLITAVWSFTHNAAVNVVYVAPDESKTDSYGRQIERYSSCMHESYASSMSNPGRFWRFKS